LLSDSGKKQILAYLARSIGTILTCPCQCTALLFRRQVWQQLRTIPYGRTRSYSELAADLGNRHKARAVGRSSRGQSARPDLIPCHRLIGADGSLTGFGGGLDHEAIPAGTGGGHHGTGEKMKDNRSTTKTIQDHFISGRKQIMVDIIIGSMEPLGPPTPKQPPVAVA
jgi:O-6-methylguanine DNA methyltransferase